MSNTVAKRIIILFIKSIDKYADITPTSANLLPLFLSSQPQLCVQRLPFPPLFISPWSATPTVVQGGHHLNRCRARRQLTPFNAIQTSHAVYLCHTNTGTQIQTSGLMPLI